MAVETREDSEAFETFRHAGVIGPKQRTGASGGRRLVAWLCVALAVLPLAVGGALLAVGHSPREAAGAVWTAQGRGSLDLAQAVVQRYVSPDVWEWFVVPALLLPLWLLLPALALPPLLLAAWLVRRRMKPMRLDERRPLPPGLAAPATGARPVMSAAPDHSPARMAEGARAAAGRLSGQSPVRPEDLDFMPDIAAAARRAGHRFAYFLTLTSLAFVVVFVVWAQLAVLDEVTRGEAKIIPSSRVQVVQNLEGGIVIEILVREGSIVEKGDILLRIDNVTAASTYRENRRRYLNLLASVARLESEISGREEILFPQEVLSEAPDTVAQQRQLLASRRSQLGSQIGVLKAQSDQRRQEIEEMRSRGQQLERALALAREELAITEPLVREGVMPRLDLLKIQRQIADTDGELRTIRLSIPRAQTALSEAEQRVEELRATQRVEAGKELNQLRADLDSVAEGMLAGVDRVSRSEVRSPVRGTVKSLAFNTVGGVVQPGQNIMEIVPLADTLLVEAKIRPADIAFLRPGQAAKVKITAYDFSIYGGLDAVVEQISADTIIDEAKKENFYRVQLRSDTAELMHNGKLLPIIPGMTATVDILTGKKSVFAYLMKPILKARDTALRER